jgi:hypothetical protein
MGATHEATEKPPGETAGWAPADVATAVLEQQDVKSVLGRQVRSITGEDMGRVVNVVVRPHHARSHARPGEGGPRIQRWGATRRDHHLRLANLA